jgi:hypothetical protein
MASLSTHRISDRRASSMCCRPCQPHSGSPGASQSSLRSRARASARPCTPHSRSRTLSFTSLRSGVCTGTNSRSSAPSRTCPCVWFDATNAYHTDKLVPTPGRLDRARGTRQRDYERPHLSVRVAHGRRGQERLPRRRAQRIYHNCMLHNEIVFVCMLSVVRTLSEAMEHAGNMHDIRFTY